MRRFVLLLILFVYNITGYSWNAAGHKLVAQIAYDNLSPQAKKVCSQIFHVKEQNLQFYFVTISTWMDDIRRRNVHQFNSWHYVDIPFTKDKTKLPEIKSQNAVWAIHQAVLNLSSSQTKNSVKALNLKILIHVVGDIHQPLHTATKVSRRLPKGDLGGNLYLFSRGSSSKNLHQYWDGGAGALTNKSLLETKIKATILEKFYPCTLASDLKKPEQWAENAHLIAVNQAYALRSHRKPNKFYQYKVRHTVAQQIALAGCRLADLLNSTLS